MFDPIGCALCARTIGKRGGHNVTDRGEVVCSRCALDRTNHARVAPDCPTSWHDVHDHLTHVAGTRAATAIHLARIRADMDRSA